MKASPTQRILGWVTVALLVGLLVGIVILRFSVTDLNTDDDLINRGQDGTNCIGDRADAIDDWRAIFLGLQTLQQEQFLIQVERVQDGVPIDTRRAERLAQRGFNVERKIRLLVEEKRDLRDQSRALIADGNPDARFVCPAIAAELVPPPLEDP